LFSYKYGVDVLCVKGWRYDQLVCCCFRKFPVDVTGSTDILYSQHKPLIVTVPVFEILIDGTYFLFLPTSLNCLWVIL
jgi:hypothetical protein